MKIAKKVLAVVMAVAMIACLSAMAFATESKVILEVEAVAGNTFNVVAYANDYVDLEAANWEITYDASAINCVSSEVNVSGAMGAINTDVAGKVSAGIIFMNAFGQNGKVALFTLNFEVVDATAKDVEIVLTGDDGASATVVVLKEEETTAAPEETTAAPEETTAAPEETTAAPEATTAVPEGESTTNKTEGVPAGDTGVLAIAAGVVALAGAAFVVSKKRK